MKYSHMLSIIVLGVCATFNSMQAMEEEPMVRKGPMTQQERYSRRSNPMTREQTEQGKLTSTKTLTTDDIEEMKAEQQKEKKKKYYLFGK